MEPLVAVALALALGFVLGAGFGTLRALRSMARYRGQSASIARFLPDTRPNRSAADALAGRVRILMGGVMYELPVLPRGASRAWLAELDAKWGALPGMLQATEDNVDEAVRLLGEHTDAMLDALLAYDQTAILPPRADLDAACTDAEILQATVECWLAANPLAASIVAAMGSETPGTSPEPPSSVPTLTAGVPSTSSGS